MNEIKLKPCPFCGSEAQFKTISNKSGNQSVGFEFEISCKMWRYASKTV